MRVDLNVLARAAKLVALLGFFLPWVMVSCSGNEIAHGNGFQMMTGHLQVSEQLQQQGGQSSSREGEIELFLALGFGAIVLGLLASLVLRKRAAAAALLAGAVLGVGLSYASFEHMRASMVEASSKGEQSRPTAAPEDDLTRSMEKMQTGMRDSMANAITIQKQEGFWVTAAALVIAALLALASLTGVRLVVATNPTQSAP